MNFLENLIVTNIHLGHSIKKYNSKMLPYIYSERNGIHIIDILQTFICLQGIYKYLFNSLTKNRDL